MRHGTQSRLNLIESDDSEGELNDENQQSDHSNNSTIAIVNVDVHETNDSNIHNDNNSIKNNSMNEQNCSHNDIVSDSSIISDENVADIGDCGSNDINELTEVVLKPRRSNDFLHNTPPDKYNICYLVFYLLGIATMCPWNFFVTADDYWMYKFRNVTNNDTNVLTPWQKSFESDITLTASFSGTLFLVLSTIFGYLFSIRLKMLGTSTLILVCFLITTAFIEVNTDTWQSGFFLITIVTIININVFSAIFSGALFGIAGLFPSEYMTAVVSGQALGGIFTALAFIITLTFGATVQATAFAYFSIGSFIIFFSIIMYIIIERMEYFKYHLYEKTVPLIPNDPNHVNNAILVPNIKTVFCKIYVYALIIFLVFTTSLTVYPSVTVLVRSQHHGNGKAWNDVYFMPVVNYLIFNSGDYLGRILAGLYQKPRNPHTTLLWAVIRMSLVPAFLVCNVDHVYMPTLIHSDTTFILLMVVFAISNGYLTNNVLINVPRVVMRHEKEMASSIMVTCLSTGLAVGSAASLFLVQVL